MVEWPETSRLLNGIRLHLEHSNIRKSNVKPAVRGKKGDPAFYSIKLIQKLEK